MPSPIFPLRLFKEDQQRRKTLTSYFRKKEGRAVSFAFILRQLMIEKITQISRL